MGLKRDDAARFSFLLGAPIILGAGLKSVYDVYKESASGALGSGDLEPNHSSQDVKQESRDDIWPSSGVAAHFVPLLRSISLQVHWLCPAVVDRSIAREEGRGCHSLCWQSQLPSPQSADPRLWSGSAYLTHDLSASTICSRRSLVPQDLHSEKVRTPTRNPSVTSTRKPAPSRPCGPPSGG